MDDRRAHRLARQREVAHLIRTLRNRAGLTQDALARKMTRLGERTSRSQVSMWEIGGEAGQLPSTLKFLALLQATEPEDRPESAEERQARVLRSRLTDLRRPRLDDR